MLHDTDNSPNWSFYVAIAWSFATPRRTIDERPAVYNSYDGVVIVHKVATRYCGIPKVCVCAFASATWSCHQKPLAIASDYAGMNKESVLRGCSKSIGYHQTVVQTINVLCSCAFVYFYIAYAEVRIRVHACTDTIIYVEYIKTISSIAVA